MSKNVVTPTVAQPSWMAWVFEIVWAPICVFLLHQVSIWLTNGEYWWDEPMHIAGGMAIAWMGCMFWQWLRISHRLPALPRWFKMGALLGLVCIAGVVWEWYEFIRWITIDPGMDLTLPDTLKDLLMDMIGGGLVVLFGMPRES